jgi:hypothetical protein
MARRTLSLKLQDFHTFQMQDGREYVRPFFRLVEDGVLLCSPPALIE